ncbi:hypothetical protein CYLTODRAFT_449681 [Cylindrobasidium torrendii FP15055 ss-10]|uniref:Uncharacterized protein n=1 Tax=Cylindrobasidium torrendii FP15055 ss-10 TaxID=1314674 RepID=A0A0D7BT01_9AGAR|nr:hypothetical protein CYLTODRAFT_449681 [Cylindrobasidium torrendii FP15055 ss-10]
MASVIQVHESSTKTRIPALLINITLRVPARGDVETHKVALGAVIESDGFYLPLSKVTVRDPLSNCSHLRRGLVQFCVAQIIASTAGMGLSQANQLFDAETYYTLATYFFDIIDPLGGDTKTVFAALLLIKELFSHDTLNVTDARPDVLALTLRRLFIVALLLAQELSRERTNCRATRVWAQSLGYTSSSENLTTMLQLFFDALGSRTGGTNILHDEHNWDALSQASRRYDIYSLDESLGRERNAVHAALLHDMRSVDFGYRARYPGSGRDQWNQQAAILAILNSILDVD